MLIRPGISLALISAFVIFQEANPSKHRRRLHSLRYGRVANKGAPVKGFPAIQEVEKADKVQLARWYRFLPSGETAAEQEIMKRIAERFEKLGGMTAELSKKIGM